jgi:predicted transcriptional regulator
LVRPPTGLCREGCGARAKQYSIRKEIYEETQNMAADALLMVIDHVNDDVHYRLTEEQVAGVHHAMGQADRGEFATDAELKEIFGRSL